METARNWTRMARGMFAANGGEGVQLLVGGSRGEWEYLVTWLASNKIAKQAKGMAPTKLEAMLAAERAAVAS